MVPVPQRTKEWPRFQGRGVRVEESQREWEGIYSSKKISLTRKQSLRTLDSSRPSVQCQPEPGVHPPIHSAPSCTEPWQELLERPPLGHQLGCTLLQPLAWRAVSTWEERVYLGCGKAGFTRSRYLLKPQSLLDRLGSDLLTLPTPHLWGCLIVWGFVCLGVLCSFVWLEGSKC